jgi:dCMP deaminase
MNQKSDKLVAGYMPVVHQGYLDILARHPDSEVGIFDSSITSQFDYLRKDIRAVESDVVARILSGLGHAAISLGLDDLISRTSTKKEIILFDDDVSHTIVETLPESPASITFDSPFLRWDRRNSGVNTEITPDRIVNDLDHIAVPLFEEAEKSSDWWRQVAAGIIDNGQLIVTHNRAMPHEHAHFIDGDPRITSGRGADIDKSLFIHAEADLIAHMAQVGISTRNKDIFVTTFPCPNCAKLIAASGMKACYFIEGYATLDGQRVLKDAGVEIVKVENRTDHADGSNRWRAYPEKSNG